jgi:hypothetical protein
VDFNGEWSFRYLLYASDKHRSVEFKRATVKSPNAITDHDQNLFESLLRDRVDFINEVCQEFPLGIVYLQGQRPYAMLKAPVPSITVVKQH